MVKCTPWRPCGEQIKGIRTGNSFAVEKDGLLGGMGLVAIARRQKDGKLYALKTLRTWEPENFQQRTDLILQGRDFHRESLVWITLGKHPHVVQALWFDWDEGYRPFLVMEFVEGGAEGTSLWDKFGRIRQCCEPRRAVRWLAEAAAGLRFARERVRAELGVPFSHRDIKPGNLLVGRDDRLKVTDFGLVLGPEKQGTPPYMPPEQWQGEVQEEKTDVYALGCVLYELVTGRPPLGWGRDKERYRQAHLHQAAPPLPGAPSRLASLYRQCLSKAPEQRPGLGELRQALEEIHEELTGEPLGFDDHPEPLGPEDENARGSGFSRLGYYRQALACFQRAIALGPQEARFHLNRGNTCRQLGNLEEAEADYRRALELAPASAKATLALGDLYGLQGRWAEAWQALEAGWAREPHEPLFAASLGMAAARRQEFPEAVQYFQRALELNPDLAEAHLGLGNVYFLQGRLPEAEASYLKALALHPLFGQQAYVNLASLYEHLDRPADRDRALLWASLLTPVKAG